MITGLLRTIDWGTAQDDLTVTVYFAPAGVGRDGFTSEGFNFYERGQFADVFELISNVCNLDFVVTNDPDADFQLVLDTNEVRWLPEDEQFLGYFYPPGQLDAGIGVFNGDFWDRQAGGDLRKGGAGFATILHEVLHGLGLAHPHDRGGISSRMEGVTRPFDDLGDHDLNQGIFTAMSYNGGHQSGRLPPFHGRWGYEATPMAIDIALLQEKYGARANVQTGNNTYVLPAENKGGTMWRAIWDTGGTDTLRHDGTTDAVIDLRAATLQEGPGGGGYASFAHGVAGGFTIAAGVVIENAKSGGGADWLRGNGADNWLDSGYGDDTLIGAAGDDRLLAGGGRDLLAGGGGADTLEGGGGADTLEGGNGADTLDGGGGDDRLDGEDGTDVLRGRAGDDLLAGQARVDALFGGRGNDRLLGGGGNDSIAGGAGDDRILGGRGADRMAGEGGADTFAWRDTGDSRIGQEDVIVDFDSGLDLLDLSQIDADTGRAGNQAFVFIDTAAFSGTAGEVRAVRDMAFNVRIEADTDGDSLADFAVDLVGPTVVLDIDLLL